MRVRLEAEHEGREALSHAGYAVLFGAAAWAVRAYAAGDLPEVDLGVDTSGITELLKWAGVVLGVLAAVHALVSAVRAIRWTRARAQLRMARDPSRAPRLPAAAGHDSVLKPSRTFLVTLLVIAAFVGVLYLGGRSRSPLFRYIDSASGTEIALWLLAGALGVLAWLVVWGVRMRRRLHARAVQRLSQDAAYAEQTTIWTAEVSPRRAAAIPELRVHHYSAQPVWTTGLRPISTSRNLIGRRPWQIAYFRLFENEVRVRDFLTGAFREFGYVHLLRSAASVGRAERESAERARAGSGVFLASRHRMIEELAREPADPLPKGRHTLRSIGGSPVRVRDRYGSYPVRALLCHGGFWKQAVDVLLDRADVVVIDLSGFRGENAGTGYELQRVIDRFPIRRVLVLADPGSDTVYLEAQVRHAWSRMAHGSPNAGTGRRHLLISTVGLGGSRLATRPLLVYLHQYMGDA
ncbi:hypothetical protein HII36_45795 [Nonomuraea sp. NN258]|uniref:hypothetical protein n=1 Tax=Nonomuraea antri TaxID=2730852 RepID=UPI00156984F3|nr:hypothetical protein [Nonomuraea antri]NRQ39089.1 hypothetical protein [Nonomuraea antri]